MVKLPQLIGFLLQFVVSWKLVKDRPLLVFCICWDVRLEEGGCAFVGDGIR